MRGWKLTLPAVVIAFGGFLYTFFGLPTDKQRDSRELAAPSTPVFEPAKDVRDVTPDEMDQIGRAHV